MSALEEEDFDYYRDVVEDVILKGLRDDWIDHAEPVGSVAEIRQRLSKAHFPGVKRLTLFGSFAKGDNVETSDVDLLVDCDADIDIFDLTIDVERVLGRLCDIVELSECKSWIKSRIEKSPKEIVYAAAD